MKFGLSTNSAYRYSSKFVELSKKARIQASFQRQIIFCFVHPNQLIQVQDVTGMSSTDIGCWWYNKNLMTCHQRTQMVTDHYVNRLSFKIEWLKHYQNVKLETLDVIRYILIQVTIDAFWISRFFRFWPPVSWAWVNNGKIQLTSRIWTGCMAHW